MSQYGNYKPKLNLYRSCDSSLRLYGMSFKDDEVLKDSEFYQMAESTLGYAILKRDIAFRNFKREFTKDLLTMTKLALLNYFVQFLFIRVYASYDANGTSNRKKWTIKGYGILYFVLPLTGWFNYNYFVIGNKIRFTKLFYKCV